MKLLSEYRKTRLTAYELETRKGIALGTAKGLAYLHEEICDRHIIHRDIKAANILLNGVEAVIAGFGLGIIFEQNTTSDEQPVSGTLGHIAPEYLKNGTVSEKIDVYSYGVFLLELITGQRAWDPDRRANGEDGMLVDWVKRIVKKGYWEIILDEYCHRISKFTEDVVKVLLHIALLCIRTDPKERPKMSEVVKMFEDGTGLPERWEERMWIKNATDEQGNDATAEEGNYSQSSSWIIGDSFTPAGEELSGPR